MSGAAMIAKQNRYMHAFKMAGAVNEENAKSLEELRIVPKGFFYRMERRGIFQRTADGKYFMNEEKAAELVQRRRTIAWTVLAIFAGWLILSYLLKGSI